MIGSISQSRVKNSSKFSITRPSATSVAFSAASGAGLARPAIFAALLYTFLPYHFVRGEHHLFLAAYFTVPLAVLMTLWVAAGTANTPRRRLACGAICLLLVATETPEGVLNIAQTARHPRVSGINWGAEDLSAALGYWSRAYAAEPLGPTGAAAARMLALFSG